MRIQLSDRFRAAAEQWADERVMSIDAALDAKAEQALLEIEHLVADAHEVDYEVDDEAVMEYDPSDELYAFLSEQAEFAGIDPKTVLSMYVDLFAGAFLSDDSKTEADDRLDPEAYDASPNIGTATRPEDYDGASADEFEGLDDDIDVDLE